MVDTDSIRSRWTYSLKWRILATVAFVLVVTMAVLGVALRRNLLLDSAKKTNELTATLETSMKSFMLLNRPDAIQNTLRKATETSDSIIRAFVSDATGTVVYASDLDLIGHQFDRFKEASCRGCHQGQAEAPSQTTIIIQDQEQSLHRSVRVMFNEPACYGCHGTANHINGKLFVDRSLASTYAFIGRTELAVLVSGILCLLVLAPLMSRGLNRYIHEIRLRENDLIVLCTMLEKLSKTIDLGELKYIVIEMVQEMLGATEVDMVLPRSDGTCRCTTWSRETGKTSRKKIEPGSALAAAVDRWLHDPSYAAGYSEGDSELYIPVSKGGVALALLVARGHDRAKPGEEIYLVEVMAGHIAVAFENARLYSLAITDELTHLNTRRHFEYCIGKKFSQCQEEGGHLTLLILDVDNFKGVNDTYGHPAGDAVLKLVSARIYETIRENDLAFRYGGEEFAVLLAETPVEGAVEVAERVRLAIAEAVFEEDALHVTISIGAAETPLHASSIEDLVKKADKALYEAKKTGKNKVVVSSEGAAAETPGAS